MKAAKEKPELPGNSEPLYVSSEMRMVDADLTLGYPKEHPLQQLAC